ncbi:hypothetical protein EV127DRAFT_443142 [Xylaria flabelliformis]|nr:hypothetical protein EV127DRAFT_443142 [Xylaria flabelliformis]
MNSTQPPPQLPLIRVPGEISLLIYSHLSNRDIKNLRLVSSFFERTACLRLARVFISANPLNIEVFEAISQHDRYRAQVTEIIWDEALLDPGPESGQQCPRWYRLAYEDCCWRSHAEEGIDYRPDAPQLSLEESWAYYQSLLRQQQEVLDSRAHVLALESAIGRFPALRKITITGIGYGLIQRYETPMDRAFPYGAKDMGQGGFRVVMHLLAQNLDAGKVTELDIRAFCYPKLSIDFFEKPCQALTDFQTVLWRGNFESLHLDLTLNAGDNRSRYPFERVLAGAADGQGLKKLTLHSNDIKFPLRTIFNPSSLLRLEHFNLTHFWVDEQDLLAVLAMLPRIRTIELNWLFVGNASHYSLLHQIKDTLGWQDRIIKPRLSFVLDYNMGRSIWVEKEVHEFLYEGGVNPFRTWHSAAPRSVGIEIDT